MGCFGLAAVVIQTLALVAVKGAGYDKKFSMVGKLADKYQPYGVWYEDLTSAKSVEFIDVVKDLVRLQV